MPAVSSPCVLVVADPGRIAELTKALSEPLALAGVELLTGAGGDDTIEAFEARRPRVVVLTATLELGDAASLIEVLRQRAPRDELVVVLVGDEPGGLIRNSLDALDLKPDRFVSRPLSVGALRTAVQSALEMVARARGEAGNGASLATQLAAKGPFEDDDRHTQPLVSRSGSYHVVDADPDAAIPTTRRPTPQRGSGPIAVTRAGTQPVNPPTSPLGSLSSRAPAPPRSDDTASHAPTQPRTTTPGGSRRSDPAVSRSRAIDPPTAPLGSRHEPTVSLMTSLNGPPPPNEDSDPATTPSISRTMTRASEPVIAPRPNMSPATVKGIGMLSGLPLGAPAGDSDDNDIGMGRSPTAPRASDDNDIAMRRSPTAPHGSDENDIGRAQTAARGSDENDIGRSRTAPRASDHDIAMGRSPTAPHASLDEPAVSRTPTAPRGSADDPAVSRTPTAPRGSADDPAISRSDTLRADDFALARSATIETGPPADTDTPTFGRSPTAPRFSAEPAVGRVGTDSPPSPASLFDEYSLSSPGFDEASSRPPTAPRISEPVESSDVPPFVSRPHTLPGTGSDPNVGRVPTDRGTPVGVIAPNEATSDPASTRAALRARWEALADSITDDELGDDELDDIAPPLPPIEIQPRRKGSTNPEFQPLPPVTPWRPGTLPTHDPAAPDLREEPDIAPPMREPTLILHDTPHPAATLPTTPPPMPERPATRWSTPVLLSELIDRSRDSSRELLANVAGADDLADLDDIDDDIIAGHPVHTPPPHLMRGGHLHALEDLVEAEAPPDLAPSTPSEQPAQREERSSARDFARQLRAKMSMMAQRLFQSADSPAAPAVEVGPRHDHHTEIDLASLGEEPALAPGVTEIEVRGKPIAEQRELTTSPGSWDTQVRERGLPDSGEIVRGISDGPIVLARMFALGFTGRVLFRKDEVEKVVYFDQGRPVFAASNAAGDRMGELLVREGKITASQYERCQVLVEQSGRRMGEILVDYGYLKRRELLPAVRRHVEDIVYSLFGWDRGHYHVTTDPNPSAERIRLSRHPAALVLEGIRRKLGRTTLEKLLGPASTVIEVPDRERLGGILNTGDLAAEERAALAGFDGQADLAQVARATGVDIADVLPLAWGLCVLGLASARRTETESADESTALVGETDLAIDRERVHARWQLVTEADYFALLGVRRDATGFEIRRAYQAARRDFAADCFPPDLRRELARELEDIASVLDEAFRVLRDDRLRQTYLANLIE